jgi:Predicted transcriptional regulator, contains C-terminal CBS domains
MKVNKIMSMKIININKDKTIYECAEIMKKNNIGFILVTDDKKLLGVLTDRDIVVNYLANKDVNKLDKYISKNVITVNINDDATIALEKMKTYKIKRLIVVDNNKIKGVISMSDLYNNVVKEKLIESIEEIFKNSPEITFLETDIKDFYL